MKNLNHLLLTVFALSLFTNTGYAQESEKGNLLQVSIITISPEHRREYEEWIKQFKEIADATNGPTYYGHSLQGKIHYVSVIGKEMSEYAAYIDKWKEWRKANPKIKELYNKYSYTYESYHTEIWRYAPDLSYTPAKARPEGEYKYTRATRYFVKPNKVDAFKSVIHEFIEEYKKLEVPFSVNCYWSGMGVEGPCLLVRVSHLDELDWAKSGKAFDEIVKDNEKIKELRSDFSNNIRKSESFESFSKKEWSHVNEDK